MLNSEVNSERVYNASVHTHALKALRARSRFVVVSRVLWRNAHGAMLAAPTLVQRFVRAHSQSYGLQGAQLKR